MAKKKANEEVAQEEGKEEKKTKDNDLEKKYGSNAFISAEDFMNEKREVISIAPKLDMILDGGIPEGSFVTLYGPKKVGKTVTSLHFAANAQAVGRKIYYLNVEGRIKPRDLDGIPKLQRSKDKFEIVRSYMNPDGTSRILLAHEFLDIAETKIKTEPGCVIILDSASQLLTELEKDGDLGQQHRAPGAILLSQFCKRISNVLPVSKSILLVIAHVVANTGGGNKRTSRTGGNKIQYAVDVDLECTYAERWTVGAVKDDPDSGTQIGNKIHWITGSTGGHASPGMKTTSYLRFGFGIDEAYELFDIGKTLGIVRKSGAWFYFDFLEGIAEVKAIQGEENAMDTFQQNPEWIEILRTKIKEMIG